MAAAGMKRRSVRQAVTRKRSVYAEPDTDDDFDYHEDEGEPEPEPTIAQPPPHPSRKRQRRNVKQTRPRTRPQTRSSKNTTSKSSRSRVAVAKTVAKAVGKRRKPSSQEETTKREFSGPSDNVIPAWTSLPVEILRMVFDYASMPRHEPPATAR